MLPNDDAIRHLYLHIPFCPSKCSYCAFVTHVGSLKLLEPYLGALHTELSEIGVEYSTTVLDTVYFGGGTPSVLTPAQLCRTLRHIATTFAVTASAEITIEAHPATVDAAKLAGYLAAGVTRISFGAESLDPNELAAVGRSYSPQQVTEAVSLARVAGFTGIALDLMYGLPEQTVDSWGRTLMTALDAGVDHFSLYPLAIEPFTVFARRRREGRLTLPADETVIAMYATACDLLRGAGYEHYEVSNWARPGHRCRHNEGYWYNREFHAVGVGAHGYVKPFRYEHLRQTKRYIDAIAVGGSTVVQREPVSAATELTETVMLRLRLLNEGLDLDEITSRFGVDLEHSHSGDIRELCARGLTTLDGRHLRLTECAVPIANEVWQRFM